MSDQITELIKEHALKVQMTIDELESRQKTEVQEAFDQYLKKAEEKQQEKAQEVFEKLNTLEETNKGLEIKLKKIETDGNPISKSIWYEALKKYAESGEVKGNFDIDLSTAQFKVVGNMSITNNTTGQVTTFDQLPEILPIVERQVHVRQLLRVGVSTSDVFNFRQHIGGEGAIDTVAEAALKTQIDYDFENKQVPVIKIAGFAVTSDEFLDDIPEMEAFLNTRLTKDWLLEEDQQVLYGDGVAPNMTGLSVNAEGAADISAGFIIATPNKFDALTAAIQHLAQKNYTPSVIVLSPEDYYDMVSTKGSDAQYVNMVVFSGQQAFIHGIPVTINTAVTTGEFFVWDGSRAAELRVRKSIELNMFDQDGTNARTNEITVRVEGREALPIYYPDAIFHDTFAAVITAITT